MATIQTSFGNICIRAIQDLAPLLPLLGTEVSRDRVAWALDNGLLYPAAAPMTIFGSFGIILVGFIALMGSIDLPYFHGPTRMKNAGFHASGMGTLLLHVNESKHHLYCVEDRLRTILAKKKVRSVEVNIFSYDIVLWNLRLAGGTILLSSLGIIPYIPLILYSLPDQPFRETWLYPILRIVGCGIVAVSIQFLFQLRILEEIYHRLRFLAADHYLKSTGKSLPEFWDPNRRSKTVFAKLREHARSAGSAQTPRSSSNQGSTGIFSWLRRRTVKLTSLTEADGLEPLTSTAAPRQLTTQESMMFLDKIHMLGTFCFPIPTSAPTQPPTPATATSDQTRQPNAPSGSDTKEPSNLEPSASSISNSSRQSTNTAALEQVAKSKTASIILFCAQHITTLGLVLNLILLLAGVGLAIFGYIGCFGIVQANRNPEKWAGPVVWVLCEDALFFVRTTIWAWNPKWDDPPSPIVLEKESTEFGGSQEEGEGEEKGSKDGNRNGNGKEEAKQTGKKKFSYGIGWTLNSVTADDMHAIIIGINDYTHSGFSNLTGARFDAVKIEMYLERTLLVPSQQIRTLYNSAATKDKIVEEIKSLKHRVTVTRQAPIVIFYAGHSVVYEGLTYLVPYQANVKKKTEDHPESDWLPYSEVVSLLRQIGEEKTDNIVLILDCCYAGAMANNNQWATDALPTAAASTIVKQVSPTLSMSAVTEDTSEILIGHASHILLAGAAANQNCWELDGGNGGNFTSALLEVLKEAETSSDLKQLTYKGLVDRITKVFAERDVRRVFGTPVGTEKLIDYQRVLCTTIYQDQPLFDGLFKRRRDEASKPVVTVKYSD